MIVKEIKQEEYSKYDELVLSHGTIFNQREWLNLFGGEVRTLGIFDNNNTLIGGITFKDRNILGLKVLMAQPLSSPTSPFFLPFKSSGVKLLENKREILDALIDYIDNRRYAIVSLPLSIEIKDVSPFIWRNYKVVPRYTYRINLRKSEEEILAAMHGNTRNRIKKAIKDGLRCERVTDMSEVIELMRKTFQRQKMNFSESQDRRVLFEFAKPENSAAYVTYVNDKPSATTFTIRDKRTCYAVMGGYDADNMHNSAGLLADYNCILQAKRDGCEWFDFEGSIVPQIEKYMRGFGGEWTQYFVANKAWLPIEMVLKLFKRRMF